MRGQVAIGAVVVDALQCRIIVKLDQVAIGAVVESIPDQNR